MPEKTYWIYKKKTHWFCPNCEALVPDDCDICPECGYSEAVDDLEVKK